jgi:hypothetical protein
MSVPTHTPPVVFTRHVHTTHRYVLPGENVAILTTIQTVHPASITLAELVHFCNARREAELGLDDVWNYYVNLEELDGWVSHAPGDPPDEVAMFLNDNGVSISDWPPYCLEERTTP